MSEKRNPIDHSLVKKEPVDVNDVCLLKVKEEPPDVQDVPSVEIKIEPTEDQNVYLEKIKEEPTEGFTIYSPERQIDSEDDSLMNVKKEPIYFFDGCLPDTANAERIQIHQIPIEIEPVVLPVTFTGNQTSENSQLKASHSFVEKQPTSGTNPSWKYVCDICNKSFLQKSNFNYHYSIHSGEKNHKCDICNKGFFRKYHLLRHMPTHTGEKPHRCDICNKYFTAERNLKYHMRSHTATKPPLYRCDICNKSFILKYLKVHMLLHTHERPYVCEICKKGFTVQSRLKDHMSTHVDGKCHRCNICNNNYTSKGNLKSHIMTHFAESPQLSKNISNNKSQITKKESESQSNDDGFCSKEDLPHWCNICNKNFSDKWKLKRHRSIHTGEKPYECDICNKTFGQKSSLKVHLTVHSAQKPHCCNICKKQLRSKRNLNYHMMTHNPGGPLHRLHTSEANKPLLQDSLK